MSKEKPDRAISLNNQSLQEIDVLVRPDLILPDITRTMEW
jgi:hypothetical protein